MCILLLSITCWLYHAVYPPRSMDDAELNWNLDTVSLGSFMSNYAPVPEHLRRRRGITTGSANVGGERVAEESDQGIDDATEKEVRSPVPDAESDSDPEDSVPLNKRKLTTKADTSAVTPKRVRRRLVKAHVGPVFADVSGVEPETSTLNIPVSLYIYI